MPWLRSTSFLSIFSDSTINDEIKKKVEESGLTSTEVLLFKDLAALGEFVGCNETMALKIRRLAEGKKPSRQSSNSRLNLAVKRRAEPLDYDSPSINFGKGFPLPPHLAEIFNNKAEGELPKNALKEFVEVAVLFIVTSLGV